MKQTIVNELKRHAGEYVSGEYLSRMLDISRTAVWKDINELRKRGYIIESSSRKGYKLVFAPDILDPSEIGVNLGTALIGKRIVFFDEIDSTNNQVKKMASEGAEEGLVVVAESQTSGRGRLGRAWISPRGTGVWLSFLLRPLISPQEAQVITLAASAAVVSAIRIAAGIDTGVKWPNDVVLGGRKVCGILVEMSSEMDRINYIVVGIGINVSQNEGDFPEELRERAISLKSYVESCGEVFKGSGRSKLINTLLRELDRVYKKVYTGKVWEIIEEWKKCSATLGREVRIAVKDDVFTGIADDITADGRLLVKCGNGETREVLSGEVEVRGLLGYI